MVSMMVSTRAETNKAQRSALARIVRTPKTVGISLPAVA